MSRETELTAYLRPYVKAGLCLAFSGGVDSSLLLKLACLAAEEEGQLVYAVTFKTRLHPYGEAEQARRIAIGMGAVYLEVEVDEFTDPMIVKNPVDRCYRCKKLLFQTLEEISREKGCAYMMDGTNYDDRKSYRPGRRALKELGVISPFMDCQVTKEEIRTMAKALKVESANKPSAPCLATRLPYDQPFDFPLLRRIEQGEDKIKALGFYNTRLRLHHDVVRIEVDASEILRLTEHKDRITAELKQLGFTYITVDLEGFRSGSMDIVIPPEERRNQDDCQTI